jgi:hypothetical protein
MKIEAHCRPRLWARTVAVRPVGGKRRLARSRVLPARALARFVGDAERLLAAQARPALGASRFSPSNHHLEGSRGHAVCREVRDFAAG